MNAAPTCRVYGDGQQRAVIMAPVMAEWDAGAFCAPLAEYLVNAGYRVEVYDTLSLLDDTCRDIHALAAQWQPWLAAGGAIHLLAGTALGGALVQALLATALAAQVGQVLLLSAPCRADAQLNERLDAMGALATHNVPAALARLEHWVVPAGQRPSRLSPPPTPPQPQHGQRLKRGFALLNGIDLRAAVERFDKPLLSVYGQHSQLVGAAHVHLGPYRCHQRLEIPAGGMRPLLDAPATLFAALSLLLRSDQHAIGA